jgi:crossover junction endodeoxyribonuclease RuvC
MKEKGYTILGIDPGTNVSGYGLVRIVEKKPVILHLGIIRPGKYDDHYQRLKCLHERTLAIIDEFSPDLMAIEAPFYGKNVQSMLKLGRAQGAIMAAGLYRSLPVFEYAPLLVKQSITGMGRASKEQVSFFLQHLFHLTDLPKELDATDAVAVAICHFLQQSKPQGNGNKEYRNWNDFIRKNPGRIKGQS